MPEDLMTARVGDFTFAADFPVPTVDVTRSVNLKEHETINDNNVVQVMGDGLPTITIEGVAYNQQLDQVDKLVDSGEVEIYTHRWTGMGVVERVDTAFRREADPDTGDWVYDVNLDILGTKSYIPTEGV